MRGRGLIVRSLGLRNCDRRLDNNYLLRAHAVFILIVKAGLLISRHTPPFEPQSAIDGHPLLLQHS
jgi:hypothetical protein